MADFDSTKTYFIKGASLKRLADIVREKIGQNVSMTLEQMGNYIYNLKTDGFVPPDGILISGNCYGLFGKNYANEMIINNGDRITTANLTNISYLFLSCDTLESFPFTLNAVQPLKATGIFAYCKVLQPTAENLAGIQGLITDMDNGFFGCEGMEYAPAITFANDGNAHSYYSLFSNCYNLKEIGALSNMKPYRIDSIFYKCYNLRYCPEFPNFDGSALHTRGTDTNVSELFYNCYSLRTIPESFLSELYTSSGESTMSNSFVDCWCLDEIKGINPIQTPGFASSLKNCHRVKDITFAVQEDGTPYKVEWAGQTIDLFGGENSTTSYGIGYFPSTTHSIGGGNGTAATIVNKVTGYNSGITADKRVTDAESYEALKDDPDWWTTNVFYSRYNRRSAINTINSLPDTSDYIAATGKSNNTIKFCAYMGGYINYDGTAKSGGISKLTEEEIAVATAKGWTVAFGGSISY